jgi:hypothetical protein
MLVVSLAAGTALSVLGNVFAGLFAGKVLLAVLNTVVSLAIFTLLFTAIYKVVPDTAIPWRDLVLGAFVTAGGRRADRPHVLDVLFRADHLPLRGRAYQGHRRRAAPRRSSGPKREDLEPFKFPAS